MSILIPSSIRLTPHAGTVVLPFGPHRLRAYVYDCPYVRILSIDDLAVTIVDASGTSHTLHAGSTCDMQGWSAGDALHVFGAGDHRGVERISPEHARRLHCDLATYGYLIVRTGRPLRFEYVE